jgi:hypothetical protein
MSRHSPRAARLAALLATLSLLACGGDDRSDSTGATPASKHDVAALATGAFGPNRAARSGRIEGQIEITVKGVRGVSEPVAIGMTGRYRYRRGAALPEYAIDLSAGSGGVTLSSAEGRSYLTLGTTGYEVPQRVRRRLVRTAARGRNGLTRTLEQFGIAPWRWETNKRPAPGTERIDGVPTVRVDTGVDVARFLIDANTLAGLLTSLGLTRANGLPPTIPRRARRILAGSVASAKGASWIGVRDKVMRKAGLTIAFRIPRARRREVGGIAAATVVAQMQVSDVGTPQSFAAPATLEPFSNLALGLDALGDFEDGKRR